ncbi:MAG: Holliday junction resolvase RuvX [Halothiobacillus sp.]
MQPQGDFVPTPPIGTAKPMSQVGTWLAFDYGAWRTGVAVGERLLESARPLCTLHNHNAHQTDWAGISKLISTWQPTGLVLGWPILDSGETYPVAAFIRRFGQRLHGRYNLPVYFVDERGSSALAQNRVTAEHGSILVNKKPGLIDAMAAAIILETFFSQNHANLSAQAHPPSSPL